MERKPAKTRKPPKTPCGAVRRNRGKCSSCGWTGRAVRGAPCSKCDGGPLDDVLCIRKVRGPRCEDHGGDGGDGPPEGNTNAVTHGGRRRVGLVLRELAGSGNLDDVLAEKVAGSTETAVKLMNYALAKVTRMWQAPTTDPCPSCGHADGMSDGQFFGLVAPVMEQIRKLEASVTQNQANRARAGLDDTVARRLREADEWLAGIILGSQEEARARIALLPADGNLTPHRTEH